MNVPDFEEALVKIVAIARSKDARIGKRNPYWERVFAASLREFVKKLIPEYDPGSPIEKAKAKQLIGFARNREDKLALSPTAITYFLDLTKTFPSNLTISGFNRYISQAAYKARVSDIAREDKGWLPALHEHLDSKLFSLLPKTTRTQAIENGIITHDTNWKSEIHNLFFIFMVNPSSGKLEMAVYNPDLEEVSFMKQSAWFPKGKNNMYACWNFPDNYRVWPGEPIINVKKMLDI